MSGSANIVRETKPGEGVVTAKSPAAFVPIHGNHKLLLATFAGLTLGGLTLGGVVWARRAKRRKAEIPKPEAAPTKTTAAKA